jgi:hypothetical protein
MQIDELLKKVKKLRGVEIEERKLPDETRVFIIVRLLPEMPFGHGRHVWYTLVVPPGKTEISKPEINALVRHIWHAESNLFQP